MTALSLSAAPAVAQFVSGSNGGDGNYNPTTSGYFVPSAFKGTGVANNVFNFKTITIPQGVTITVTAWDDNAPVYWLASGNVDIEGTLNFAGSPGASYTNDPEDVRIPAAAGSGGYAGGVGGNAFQNAQPGSGPGGGSAGGNACSGHAAGGSFSGNQYLIPLVGGSGGGGVSTSSSTFDAGGGAGGGAILIASTTQITVNGTITANGGAAGSYTCIYPGGGSGGAIHLVSSTINGTGTITAVGGNGTNGYPGTYGGPGMVRLEAYTIGFTGSVGGTLGESVPFSNINFAKTIPTIPPPSVQVTSINGTAITENPFIFPDIMINSDQPVPLVITGHQVPIGTVPTLVILGEGADQELTCAGGLQGTVAASTCTINITYAVGGSRGLVKATWQNAGSNAPS